MRSYDEPPKRCVGCIRAAVILAILLFLALACSPGWAQGGYDPRVAAQRAEAIRSVIVTRTCMFDATTAMLRQGVRKREALELFAASACGSRMRVFLVGTAGWNNEEAEILIKGLAAKEVESALSWGQ